MADEPDITDFDVGLAAIIIIVYGYAHYHLVDFQETFISTRHGIHF